MTPATLIFFKPYGVVTQFSGEPPTLADFVPKKDVYPAGRLDKESEGLLVLTADGSLQHRLTDPKFDHPRTYWAQVERIPSEDALETLRRGVNLSGYRTRPAKAHLLDPEPDLPPRNPPIRYRKSVPTAWLALTLSEGKNRQVRHMTAAIGHPTLRLVRVAIGGFTLAHAALAPGQYRELTRHELRLLLSRP